MSYEHSQPDRISVASIIAGDILLEMAQRKLVSTCHTDEDENDVIYSPSIKNILSKGTSNPCTYILSDIEMKIDIL
jgi:hypothetical protein